jgi:hypothetical protein
MGDQPVLVLLVAAVLLLVLAAIAVWVRSLLRPVRPVSSIDPGAAPAPGPGADGLGRPLARGFSYLFSPLGLQRRRRDLSGRLDRALQRIDQVDPYTTHRRIGLALLAAGSTQAPEQGGPAPAARPPTGSTPWPPVPGPADPRETGR